MLMLSGCQPKVVTPPMAKMPPPQRLGPPPQSAAEIQALMVRAQLASEVPAVLSEFDRLARTAPTPIREEAIFRKAEVMLERQLPGAYQTAEQAIAAMPQNALVPYARFWQAKWWLAQGNPGQALDLLSQVLHHPRLTRELADETLAMGPSVAQQVDEWAAVSWLLAAAEVDSAGRDAWLRAAARRASIATLQRLHQEGEIQPALLSGLDVNAARLRLFAGNSDEVEQIAALMRQYIPGSPSLDQLKAWAAPQMRPVSIGVLLPLSGPYARYGDDALKGVRLALASLESGAQITLRIEDTAGDPGRCIEAYNRLAGEGVDMVVGPLLSKTTQALVPVIRPEVPVLSMSSQVDLASASPYLFIHTLSPLAQVKYMAEYARQQGIGRIAVISEETPELQREAHLFASLFTDLGGQVVDEIVLPEHEVDDRPYLERLNPEAVELERKAKREKDPEKAAELHKEAVETPLAFDAIYLALHGQQMALIAGQLVYTDINNIPLYGSSRWMDGHLLDDKGRYLGNARFVALDASGMDAERLNRMRTVYRQVWGDSQPSNLIMLAHDTLLIAAVVTGRLGMHGSEIGYGLRDPEGFPSLTGQVTFDGDGVGQKKLDIYMIRDGGIVPSG